MSLPFLLASDLDRTLVHSAARLAEGEDAPVVEVYKGRGITVAREATIAALAELAAAGAFVPVTTRSQEQVARITPIWAFAADGWLICSNGGTLLHHGEVDAEWAHEVDLICAESAPVAEARHFLETAFGTADDVPWIDALRAVDDHFLYAVLDLAAAPSRLAEHASEVLAPLNWHAILHGRKLYALPENVCKGQAARHLRERLGVEWMMAAGDSLLDVELLLEADEAWVPVDAELVDQDRVPHGARVTTGGHVAAGQEIAEAARAAARGALSGR